MKNIFGLKFAENAEIDGKGFILRESDDALLNQMDDYNSDYEAFEKKSGLPSWVTVIYYISLFLALGIPLGLFQSVGKTSFIAVWNHSFWLIIIGIISWIILFILHLYKKVRIKRVVESNAFNTLEKHTEELYQFITKDLKIPANASQVDILFYMYKEKKGKLKPISSMYQYKNTPLLLFVEKGSLCLADISMVLAIPLESITRIIRVNKRTRVYGWNKQEPYNKGEYKKYKITKNKFDILFFKPYYSLQLSNWTGDYEILIPAYDIDKFKEATKLPVIEATRK